MRIAVIGCGNMSRPLIKCIHSVYKDVEFHTYTPSKTKSLALSAEVNGVHHDELFTLCDIDYWFIACKPQQLNALGESLGTSIHGQKIISVLAATSIEKLARTFNSEYITRIMPNTPSLYGEGVELVLHSKNVEQVDQENINKLFKTCGELVQLSSEKELDELTILSGSGPAYIYRFALAYEKKFIEMGYSKEMVRTILNKLFLGTATMMTKSDNELSLLVDNVTSKAGVTIEAVKVLESGNIDTLVSNSLESALERSNQIAQELG